MKITYTPNPLRTVIELDEHEQKTFWQKLKIEAYEDMVFSAHYSLTHKNPPDVEDAKKELDPDYWCSDDKSKLDARIDELMEHYLLELRGWHCGDCTCFAMSCSKCHAESLIGINTTKGLGKHAGHKVESAFSYKEGDEWKQRTLDEALEILRTYDPKPQVGAGWDKVGGWEKHVPRWKAEAASAYEWLLAYRDQHFPKEQA